MYNFIKRTIIIALAAVLLISVPGTSVSAEGLGTDDYLDKSDLANGIITVKYPAKESDSYVVRTEKGNSVYTYDYTFGIRVPLQGGEGTYTIQVLAPLGGQNYTPVAEQTVEYKTKDVKNLYLQSSVIVNFDSASKAVKKAAELTADSTTDSEKVLAIYNYIVKNIKYDFKKAAKVQSFYLSNPDDTLKQKTGICYDYSILFASMLRSVGIPAKVLMGTSKDIVGYHAWNQVYIKETDKWITVDTTIDAAQSKSSGSISAISKKVNRYTTEKLY